MRIKLDEKLPMSLAATLRTMGHEVDTVPEGGLGGVNDAVVWSAAQAARRFLVIQDLHFSDIRLHRGRQYCGVLPLRPKVPGRGALHDRVRCLFQEEVVSRRAGRLVVATKRKIRTVDLL